MHTPAFLLEFLPYKKAPSIINLPLCSCRHSHSFVKLANENTCFRYTYLTLITNSFISYVQKAIFLIYKKKFNHEITPPCIGYSHPNPSQQCGMIRNCSYLYKKISPLCYEILMLSTRKKRQIIILLKCFRVLISSFSAGKYAQGSR